MTDEAFRRARLAFLRTGDVDAELLGLLRRVVAALARYGGLPRMYSPTGRWDRDAEQELFADWLQARLVGTGQLAAILHEATTPASFARIGELFLRRHVIGRLERSQASNLYARARDLLAADDGFEVAVAAARPQDVAWAAAGAPAARRASWAGSDEALLTLAWGLGSFETVRFRDNARKLSPLLDAGELRRFVAGLLDAAGAALTLSQLMRALVARFDLGPAVVESLGDEAAELEAPGSVVAEVAARDLALAALGELTRRQVDVLRLALGGDATRAIAAELGVSVGTVHADQKTTADVLGRLADPDGASRLELLNALREELFKLST